MQPSVHRHVSGSVSGLALNTLVPACRHDLADEQSNFAHRRHGTLEGLGPAHHLVALALHRGNYAATMEVQPDWRARLVRERDDTGTIFVEHDMPLGDMMSYVAEPLLGRLAPAGNLVINCQSTRESVFGSSNAGRILSEASRSGLGFTVGQRGLVGGIQALEAALVLGRNSRFSGTALLCAGDRWIDIYPRILGKWATLSDGAAAAAFTIRPDAPENLWILNDRVSSYSIDALADASHESSVARIHGELVERLSTLIDASSMGRGGLLAIASPSVCGTLGGDVERSLASRYPLIGAGSPPERTHFGSANALINLQRAVGGHEGTANAYAPDAYLTWDCDPSGLFGAVIVARSAFDTAH
ncbi:hypothetical protein WKR88_24900 [Trinickia caryophylli]|uniref:Uncharacterized protein n=1 Tax=Trinickia caryophylli TaxID=28094 RepID=A0A1X7G573_TRICW|nr:hypothetical protein [Trinickia caryophylli]PMS13802.1 hypothetical protein C0Z17_02735 [Trinickia caryophylli]TRX14303.1 hypothetical protein FNF07_23715 [Trinickia caryophylli]WQE14132.1 hypothetical protein U0034_25905 [Trinickia caryophylli]SMF64185.1 hypothetical protein SAMN06295900_113160 [Trinickia caryophylli]GLU33369.1 hypothetical protein Busp01_32110 [Trinickia caryophylli]